MNPEAIDEVQADTPQMSEEELQQKYVEELNALADHANDRGMLPVLVEVLAWKLAAISHRCGKLATGDALRQFGNHLYAMAQREIAAQEAKTEIENGRQPH